MIEYEENILNTKSYKIIESSDVDFLIIQLNLQYLRIIFFWEIIVITVKIAELLRWVCTKNKFNWQSANYFFSHNGSARFYEFWKWHNLIRFSRIVRKLNKSYSEIEKILNYKFKDIELLNEALTHSSIKKIIKKRIFNYERLEFLGDRILGFIISDLIFKKFQNFQEGELSILFKNIQMQNFYQMLQKV